MARSESLIFASRSAPVPDDHPALVSASGEVETYGQVRREAAARAAALAARTAQSGSEGTRAGLVLSADRDGVLGALAALRQPRAPVLVHPRAPPAERRALARRLDLVVVDASELVASSPRPEAPALERGNEDVAVVIPTSGSTGQPKGVRLSFRALEASARASAAVLGWRPDDRWLLTIPVAHVGGLSIVTRCWSAGAAVALPSALRGGFRPEAFVADVEATGATLVSLVPTMLVRLLRDDGFRWPRRVRVALVGGAAAPAAAMQEAHDRGWPVLATYGLTEACSQVATQRPGTAPSVSGAVGPPLPGVEVRIRDGRIQVRGVTLFSGYEPCGAPLDPGAWFDTGDYGRWDDAGGLVVDGRGEDLIVSGGENVFPAEVEAAIGRHPAVSEVLVVGLDDPEWGQVVAAAVIPRSPVDEATLAAHAAGCLAPFKRPRRWCFVDAFPLRPSGKPDRRAVRGLFDR